MVYVIVNYTHGIKFQMKNHIQKQLIQVNAYLQRVLALAKSFQMEWLILNYKFDPLCYASIN
jgi:hypothetical protein